MVSLHSTAKNSPFSLDSVLKSATVSAPLTGTPPMKKSLPFCTLTAGAAFVLFGISTVAYLAPKPEPFGLLFPLLWDIAMVGISLCVIFPCVVARKAGFVWSVFCLLASLAVAVAAFLWVEPQYPHSVGVRRLSFMAVTVGFGVIFSIWQIFVLRSPTALSWNNTSSTPPNSGHVRHG